MIKKIKKSLSFKIFIITNLLLITVCILTYVFIVNVMPKTYSTEQTQALEHVSQQLVYQLENTTLEDCDSLLLNYAINYDIKIIIADSDGNPLKTTILEITEFEVDDVHSSDTSFYFSVTNQYIDETATLYETQQTEHANAVISISQSFHFQSGTEEYILILLGNTESINQASEALKRIWPYLLFIVLIMSILSSLFYTRYITKPIVKMSELSKKMSYLEFDWHCDEKRADEIGTLGRSLNELSSKLSFALSDLHLANEKLQDDIKKERQLEKQRKDFFSAVSHELKTPITIVKGQLGGMLDHIGVYADHDKYLARSLSVMTQMEKLIQELMTISRMDIYDFSNHCSQVPLTDLINQSIAQYEDLTMYKEIKVIAHLEPNLTILADKDLIAKAIDNIMSNGVFYSPESSSIMIHSYQEQNKIYITIENTGVTIPDDSLGHLFDAFYRVEQSRNKRTGGSGLGLHLVKMILDLHNAEYSIKNTKDGVRFMMAFHTKSTT